MTSSRLKIVNRLNLNMGFFSSQKSNHLKSRTSVFLGFMMFSSLMDSAPPQSYLPQVGPLFGAPPVQRAEQCVAAAARDRCSYIQTTTPSLSISSHQYSIKDKTVSADRQELLNSLKFFHTASSGNKGVVSATVINWLRERRRATAAKSTWALHISRIPRGRHR